VTLLTGFVPSLKYQIKPKRIVQKNERSQKAKFFMRALSGIKQQTLLMALIPVLLTIFFFGSYSIFIRFSDADQALIDRSRLVAHQLALSSEYALFSGNSELLEQGINSRLKAENVNSAYILDANSRLIVGKSLVSNVIAALPDTVNAKNPIFQNTNTLILHEDVFATELKLSDLNETGSVDQTKKLGAVIIEFNKSHLHQQKLEMLLINLLFMVGVLIIAVLAALWLSRRISDPILSMGDIIKGIGSGNLIARISPQTDVLELNELARNINEMARQLEEDRDTLEQRILNATSDLRMRKDEAELAHRELLSLNEILSLAFIELESKEKAKTRFLASAGHDLRQPIAAANLFVEALKYCAPDQRQSEIIEKLDQSMNVFSAMLERLLDISQLDAGLIKANIKPVNLLDLFEWLEQTFAQTALDRQLRFRLICPKRLPLFIRTDIILLQSILMNLVSNAIKYTEQGSILISARMRGEKVLLQVWDTGIGIAEHELVHIFDEFYQVGNQHRSREGGLGLGLSICQRAISLLASNITCRSDPGRGSVFQFCLPLNREPHEVKMLPANTLPQTVGIDKLFRGKQVVVIEDDALVAGGMVSLLQGVGAVVHYFNHTADALRAPAVNQADFFIVDYALGGELSGMAFLQAVQQTRQAPIHAVVITGETSSQFISSIEHSPWPVLFKPVNYVKLAAALV
jgi:two-component system, sensor histidine kinase